MKIAEIRMGYGTLQAERMFIIWQFDEQIKFLERVVDDFTKGCQSVRYRMANRDIIGNLREILEDKGFTVVMEPYIYDLDDPE